MRTLGVLLIAVSVFSTQAFARGPGNLGLYFFCSCKADGYQFEPRQALVLYKTLSTGAVVDAHRVGDYGFQPLGPDKYKLVPVADPQAELTSFQSKQECLDIFVGNEEKICDGDVRTGTVDEDET